MEQRYPVTQEASRIGYKDPNGRQHQIAEGGPNELWEIDHTVVDTYYVLLHNGRARRHKVGAGRVTDGGVR